ncbi:PCMD domain-containing protein [Flavobacterium sp. LC2016-12]|uniref:PCMD domain-containing protein n=1 Tax=Flavobacterium sp. LC2016-12 TaxID=2783794 RepID=UPI00188C2EF4|nr:PCMD domain-containing protein [Flavobacterium sp. LC2016-12]MBF4463736.1 PCMD domain-containing protein [Flavobacterium sp. LC2016-12]
MKKLLFYSILICGLLITTAACVDDQYFGTSDKNDIRYITIENQSGFSIINEETKEINITVDADADVTKLAIDSLALSTFATISPVKETIRDFTSPQTYTVTAENGNKAIYTIIVTQEGANPQLENSAFDDWYMPSGKAYKQPGLNDNTIWATANDGTTTTSAANVTTYPYLNTGTDYVAQIITKDLGSVSGIVGQRMGSGTLFTGKFVLNISNPPASAQFGIPFTAKPKSFSAEIKYTAGTPYQDGKGKVMDKTDQADIYVILENRDNPSAIKRIATGWHRTSTTTGVNLQNISVNLTYGTLDSSYPDYQKPGNGLYGSATDKPTHIIVVFASSADGILYEGGVNSTLYVNNFKLQY